MNNQESLPTPTELPMPSEQSTTAPNKMGVEAASMQESHTVPSGGGQTQAVSPATTLPLGAPTSQIAPTTTTTGVSTSGLSAADVDLIEKEWVEKAKAIVAATNGDPYTQNKEINKIKADYMKKRYNKDIKVAGD